VISPTEVAAELISRLGVSGKPELAEIAQRIGLRIQEIDADGFEGSLVRALEGPKGIIAVKRSIRERSRKRFTIAHEIGHYVLPTHRTLENVCTTDMVESWRQGNQKPELEANEFAVELLLPARFVEKPLELKRPSLRAIAQVANEFETSLTATALRFVGLTDVPCVAVWSDAGRARWCRGSAAFPYRLPKDAIPCEGSVAYRLFQGKEGSGDFVQVPKECWLDRELTANVDRVLEHSVRLSNYDAVLSLLWFELHESGDEDESELLEELDPQEFTVGRRKWPR
jgi:Zn-dependent peptidase ImmA (M78 family)